MFDYSLHMIPFCRHRLLQKRCPYIPLENKRKAINEDSYLNQLPQIYHQVYSRLQKDILILHFNSFLMLSNKFSHINFKLKIISYVILKINNTNVTNLFALIK